MTSEANVSAPDLSVVIVAWKQDGKLKRCLDAVLAEQRPDLAIEVIVVSNAADHSVLAVINSYAGRVVHVRLRANAGFGAASNLGAEIAKGEYLVFLNDDAFPVAGALARLREAGARHGSSVIGALIASPDGTVLECGGDARVDASTSPNFRGRPAAFTSLVGPIPVPYATGCCFGVQRDLWRKIGGFDERYFPAYYEDADLCLQVRKAGYPVLVEPSAVVLHDESASASDTRGSLMAHCRRLFEQKWRMEPDSLNRVGFSQADLLRARGLPESTHVVLQIDDFYPSRVLGSGLPRMWTIAKQAKRHGVLIVSVATNVPVFGDALAFAQLGHLPLPSSIEEALERYGHWFDSVLVSRPHNFERTFRASRRHHPALPVVYDAESLFHERVRKRSDLLEGASLLLNDLEMRDLRSQEEFVARTADRIVAISPTEREWFLDNGARDVVLHRPWFPPNGSPDPPRSGPPFAVYVAGWLGGDGPNRDGLEHFIETVLPRVRLKVPGFSLHVTGRPPAGLDVPPDVRFLGLVDDLADVYHQAVCAVNPVRYGSGVKLKSVEALAHGCPLVTTRCGFEGIHDLDWGSAAYVHDGADAFAEAIIVLCQRVNDDALRKETSMRYLANYTADSYWLAFDRELVEIGDDGGQIDENIPLNSGPAGDLADRILAVENEAERRWSARNAPDARPVDRQRAALRARARSGRLRLPIGRSHEGSPPPRNDA